MVDKIEQVNDTYKIRIDPAKLIALFQDDMAMFDEMLRDNCNSRKNLLKKQQENVEPTNKKLDFETALKANPQNFVQYMLDISSIELMLTLASGGAYVSQQKVHKTALARRFDSIKTILTYFPKESKEEKKAAAQCWKSLWRWNDIVKPGFKLMPLNEVKTHFIRIDKKSLVELGICKLHSMEVNSDLISTLDEIDFEEKCNHLNIMVDEKVEIWKKLNETGFCCAKHNKNHMRAKRARGNKKLNSTNCYVSVSPNQPNPLAAELKLVSRKFCELSFTLASGGA